MPTEIVDDGGGTVEIVADGPAHEYRQEQISLSAFRSKVIAPHYLVYDDSMATPKTPYSIFLGGELSGRASGNTKHIEIDIAIAALIEEHESMSFGPGEPPQFWDPAPNGLFKWDGVKRFNERTAGNYQYSTASNSYAISGSDLNPVTPRSNVAFIERNDFIPSGGIKYRRLATLRCSYGLHDFDFSAELRLLVDNQLAKEYHSGKQVDLVWHNIKEIRVLTVFKFRSQECTTHAFVLGDGQPDTDCASIAPASGTVDITEQIRPPEPEIVYRYDDLSKNYSATDDIIEGGTWPAYNSSLQLVHNNQYGYVTNMETTAFTNSLGQIVASSGPFSVAFSSLFKLGEDSDGDSEGHTVDDLTATTFPVWQSIQLADFTIYLEDERGQRVDLTFKDKWPAIDTRSNAFKEMGEEEPVEKEFIKTLGNILLGEVPYLGTFLDAVELLSTLTPKPEIDFKELCVVEGYDEHSNQVLVDFCWGDIDHYEQYEPVRQELSFQLMFTFYTPPAPGRYDLVFKQNVYVHPSYFCEPPLNDKEYQFTLREAPGPYWMRTFETRYPVTLVEHKRYVVNTNTNEIHDTYHVMAACNFDAILDGHKVYIDTTPEMKKAIADHGYNGCHYCLSHYDTG